MSAKRIIRMRFRTNPLMRGRASAACMAYLSISTTSSLAASSGGTGAGCLIQLSSKHCAAVRYLDNVIEELFDLVPKDTYITITSDHGELFGEDGYFGHGPVQHEKVMEVPFIEGKLR